MDATTAPRPTAVDATSPPTSRRTSTIGNGDVLIAAITSCTNTSNPSVMLAAGLLAKKAVESGPDACAARQDLARARLARRHRVPRRRPACCRTSTSSASRSSATAARPASATPGPRRREIERGDHEERPRRAPACCRATATSRRASTRTSRRTSCMRRRWSWRSRSPARVGIDLMTEPLGKGQDGKDVYLRRHLADDRGDRTSCMKFALERRGVPHELRATSPTPNPLWKRDPGVDRPGLRLADSRPTSPSRRSSSDFAMTPARRAPASTARARWRSSATRSPPTTSARPARSRTTSPAGK